ncbi:MAG: hypothetical protein IJZ75_00290 [Clostridia bacterium]|nr:hypothetical protein [Clostridia bacterium]
MNNYKRSAKIALIVTYIFMLLLVAFTVALPWITKWYVEVRGRSTDLFATIMLATYPCVPFAAIVLISLRKLLKNILGGHIFHEDNAGHLLAISNSCFLASVIMIIAGIFYMPFYIAGGAAICMALLVRSMRVVLQGANHEIEKSKENKGEE